MVSPNDDGYELTRIMYRFDALDEAMRSQFARVNERIDAVVQHQEIANGRVSANEEAIRAAFTETLVERAKTTGRDEATEKMRAHNDRVRRWELAVVGMVISVFAIVVPIVAQVLWGV